MTIVTIMAIELMRYVFVIWVGLMMTDLKTDLKSGAEDGKPL